MNVLLVNDRVEKTGGAEVYVHRLKRGLARRGHEVKLFGGANPNHSELRNYVSSWYNLGARRRISTVLDGFDPDVVHCNNVFGYLSPAILAETRSRGIPTVMKIEDTRLLYPFSERGVPSRRSWWRTLHPFLYLTKIPLHRHLIRKSVDEFTAPSEYIASTFRTRAGFEPMSVVRNPVPWEVVERSAMPSKNVLFVGSVENDKGADVLLRSVARLVGEESDVTAEFIGEIERDYSRLIDQLGIGDRVDFRGFVADEKELRAAYRKAGVFVLPSTISENSPLTIGEAMSQGTPVITTGLGGQQELVRDGETGYVVPPNDPHSLARRIRRVVSDENRWRKMSNSASKYARQFSLEEHLVAVESIYERLSDQRPRPPTVTPDP